LKTARQRIGGCKPVSQNHGYRTMSKVILALGLAGALLGGALAQQEELFVGKAPAASGRIRVVVLTDFPPLDVSMDSGPAHKRSDPDDVQSMVRFLLYANECEVEGLVAASATFANVANKQNLLDILDRYDAVDENLRKHDARFPSATRLRSVTWQGASGTWGKPWKDIIGAGKDSEASERIIALLEQPDSRPIWFCVWGGSCDLAQALWKIKETRPAAEMERLLAKVRVYLIALQDGSGQWLLDTFPNLFVIVARHSWQGMFGSSALAWVNANIRKDHGRLGAVYPEAAMGTAPGVKEGDTPSFLHLVSAVRGLNDPEQPDQPSWGGQFVRITPARNHWTDHPSGEQAVRIWSRAFDNDFAARMDWCVKDFKAANHAPVVALNGEAQRDVKAGQVVKLTATATDPDGNHLSAKWRATAYSATAVAGVMIANSDSLTAASLVVPNESGKEIHILLEVTDDGTPPLVGYQRVVCNIK
jgi:hypothetical protein